MAYDDLLGQYMQMGLQGAAQGHAASQQNPLGDVLKFAIPAALAYFTGGGSLTAMPSAEVMGSTAMAGMKGLESSSNPEVAGTATGIDQGVAAGQEFKQNQGLQSAFSNLFKDKPEVANVLKNAGPAIQKDILTSYAKSLFPQPMDAMTKMAALQYLQSNPDLQKSNPQLYKQLMDQITENIQTQTTQPDTPTPTPTTTTTSTPVTNQASAVTRSPFQNPATSIPTMLNIPQPATQGVGLQNAKLQSNLPNMDQLGSNILQKYQTSDSVSQKILDNPTVKQALASGMTIDEVLDTLLK
jgi:hypothetical protein